MNFFGGESLSAGLGDCSQRNAKPSEETEQIVTGIAGLPASASLSISPETGELPLSPLSPLFEGMLLCVLKEDRRCGLLAE